MNTLISNWARKARYVKDDICDMWQSIWKEGRSVVSYKRCHYIVTSNIEIFGFNLAAATLMLVMCAVLVIIVVCTLLVNIVQVGALCFNKYLDVLE